MKLESLSIRDFRCIEGLDLDFKDELAFSPVITTDFPSSSFSRPG